MRIATSLFVLLLLTISVSVAQNQEPDPSDTSFLSSVTIPKGSTGEDVVCILCSAQIQGHLTGDVVLIGGNADVLGSVDGDVVVVGGWIRNRGSIDGEAFALGGTIERSPGSQIKGEAESFPWFHVPGQRSFHPAGALCLVAGALLFVFATGLIWRRNKSDALADRLVRRWWLALLLGGAIWFLYFVFLDDFQTDSTVLVILLVVVPLLLLIATWFGSYGLAWALGRLIWRGPAWKTRLAGALILSIALFIPVLGFAALCLIAALGLGAGLLFGWPALRTPKTVAIDPSAPETL